MTDQELTELFNKLVAEGLANGLSELEAYYQAEIRIKEMNE